MRQTEDKLLTSPELLHFFCVCATLVNMRSAANTPVAVKGKEVSPVRRSTRAKGMSQREETDSGSDDAEVYELKPRRAKNLAVDLMHPMVDFQTHLEVKT